MTPDELDLVHVGWAKPHTDEGTVLSFPVVTVDAAEHGCDISDFPVPVYVPRGAW